MDTDLNARLPDIIRTSREAERRETISDVIQALRVGLYATSDMDDINSIVRSVEAKKAEIPYVKPTDPKDGYLWRSPQGLAFYDHGQWLLVSNGQPASN